ncbi:hypothetical protein HETIRDRAFT_471477 [Heterobasidion irregulare TC 32-1]|uniref:Phospholipase A-2-activating protein n=1 Tax=Heterobasidion irregulare (strain TC 32-1) TaxID=747525 RepID=W4KKA4_HETIT|nr:uncharacterized protein HETIRDRAFT_471477 [Heterobasidion irregulare TC 32-1]ETW86144.1 hypothetical protein HETIRDRAFT_471477 [Heterobasidion irregulare TC 32-1]
MPFKLSATLSSHKSDVRAVASPTDNLVLSASRDSTAIAWIRDPAHSFSPASVFRAGERFVNSVTHLPPTAEAPHGFVVTGGQDAIINVWALEGNSEEPKYSLLGHTDNVCALHASVDGRIISGSWDRTAKVWKSFQLAYDLSGHTQSVWAVLVVDDDQYLTGSADKTIKLWQQHKCLRTYHGHKDAVRSIALVTDIGFASASNDSEICIWTLEGDIVHSLSAHTSFVYSLAVLPSGDLVSGGEDRSVRVWRDGECAQTIVHPAISVWSVSAMPNGDIVTGSSDGVVRIFSESKERWASTEDLKAFDDQVASQALPSQQVGDVKKSDLLGTEALSEPGKKPGEVKMVRNGAIVEAHQWDAASRNWQKIGEVVDAVGSGRKQLHEGKEYDYVFDVDIQDGVPPLKLPYNANENPYVAAQRFLESNDLPTTYVDQVVQFIEKNTSGVNLGSSEEFVDPYTGASRYRGSGPSAQPAASTYSDPYTGASRYIGNATPSAPSSAPSSGDPFTGASRYVNTPPSQPSFSASPSKSIIPVSKVLSFKQANVAAMQGKLYQFDEALRHEISTSSLALYPEENSCIEQTFAYLSHAAAGTTPEVTLTRSDVDTISQVLDRWPTAQLFPVLDLARLLSGYCPKLVGSDETRTTFFNALFKASGWIEDWSTPLSKTKEINILLFLRTLANAFQDKASVGDSTHVTNIFEALSHASYEVLTKTQRVALATILFNFSCIALQGRVDPTLRRTHLRLTDQTLRLERIDGEAVYRSLVGLGNMLYAAQTQVYPLEAVQASELKNTVSALPAVFSEERIKAVAGEVLALL